MELSSFKKRETFIKIGEQEYIFTEVSIKDLISFKAYLVEKKKEVNKSRKKDLVAIAKEIGNIDSLELLKLINLDISDAEFDEQMASIEGVGYLAWLSLKYKYENVLLDQALSLITSQYIDQIQEALFPEDPIKKKLRLEKQREQEKSPLAQQ